MEFTDLPDTINHHWTKALLASPDGRKLYVGVGSNSNITENGAAIEYRRAAILEVDVASRGSRIYASGLRSPTGLQWEPVSGKLWTIVNEARRDRQRPGPGLPDLGTEGGFYGWPYSYFGQHLDSRVKPQRPDLVAKAIVPDCAGFPRGRAGPVLLHRRRVARALSQRRLRQRARQLEPLAGQRLPGGPCAVRRRQARRCAAARW